MTVTVASGRIDASNAFISSVPWLLGQSEGLVLKVLACCVATTVNGVQADDAPHDADALTQATALDMRRWWSATSQ